MMKRRDFLSALSAGTLSLGGFAPQLLLAQGMNQPMRAPIHVGKSGLRARDAEALATWYQSHVGLQEIGRDGATIHMGAGGTVLLEITQYDGIVLAPMRVAGLYHNAFLLPARADLARWVLDASARQLRIDGYADHLVSEAMYLTDPEGNGVEIYADRPASDWVWRNGQVEMDSLQIDFDSMIATLDGQDRTWRGAPAGTVLGHVHLKVGDTIKASDWWQNAMGFDAVRQRAGAAFLSTGGYHHHIAVNEWTSMGAGRRDPIHVGLDFVELRSQGLTAPAIYEDDWGNQIRLLPA
ncbi:glyoxalase family protein [Ketogulonicigenium robustum]|uniref:Glyoxalase family protein n=1 Tax=Ketogulonicigenium robustum TaxID=92947 RepID=A0A1W6P202_9RHOB|nr:VOC family protein [Ketogulonicigenium robustum]ARO15360.1 glyoxalase family protein [Ketogulonicigenium robustum]